MSGPRYFHIPGFNPKVYLTSVKQSTCQEWLDAARTECESQAEEARISLIELEKRKQQLEEQLAQFQRQEGIEKLREAVITFAEEKDNFFTAIPQLEERKKNQTPLEALQKIKEPPVARVRVAARDLGLLQDLSKENKFLSVEALQSSAYNVFSFNDLLPGYSLVSFPLHSKQHPLDAVFSKFSAVKSEFEKVNREIQEMQTRQEKYSQDKSERAVIKDHFTAHLNQALYESLKKIIGKNTTALGVLDGCKKDHLFHENILPSLKVCRTLDWDRIDALLLKHKENIRLASQYIDSEYSIKPLKERLIDRLVAEQAEFYNRAGRTLNDSQDEINDPCYLALKSLMAAIGEVKYEDAPPVSHKTTAGKSKEPIPSSHQRYQLALLQAIDNKLNERSLEKHRGWRAQIRRGLVNLMYSPRSAFVSLYKGESRFFSRRGELYDAATELKDELKKELKRK